MKKDDEFTTVVGRNAVHAKVHTALPAAGRFFAQLHVRDYDAPGGERVLNRYFDFKEEGTTWVKGHVGNDDETVLAILATGRLESSR